VRPRIRAGRKPGVWYDHRQVGDGRGLTEKCPGQAQAFFNGRAEPAPSEVRWPLDIGLQEKGPGEYAMGQIPLNYRFLLTQVSFSPII